MRPLYGGVTSRIYEVYLQSLGDELHMERRTNFRSNVTI